MITELTVKAYWDDEARVWVAVSADVPGLIADAYTLEKLFTKLALLVPELLGLNGEVGKLSAQLGAAIARIEELETLLRDTAP